MKDDGKEPLLPLTHVSRPQDEEKSKNLKDYLFKCYVIVSMTFLWTSYTLTVRYTRNVVPPEKRYSSTTIVLSSEVVKLMVTIFMVFKESGLRFDKGVSTLNKYYFGAPKELLKMSVPSIAYALQNNLDFVALSNLDAGVYQVTTQLKVVTTAIFMMIFLGRRFSGTRWLAILLLFAGIACVQLNSASPQPQTKSGENYMLGITAVLATCVTAGFAGVYFEMMLKNGGDTPFWIRNMQMYSCGVISAALACFMTEYDRIDQLGFFYGYDAKVYGIVACLSLGGIYISLVMKHLDNLYKSFAAAVSIVAVVIVSYFIFPDIIIGIYFVIGTFAVAVALMLYNSVSE